MSGADAAAAQAVVERHLLGPILQVPPMVSALKVDGKLPKPAQGSPSLDDTTSW